MLNEDTFPVSLEVGFISVSTEEYLQMHQAKNINIYILLIMMYRLYTLGYLLPLFSYINY